MTFDHNIDSARIHVVATQTTAFYLIYPGFFPECCAPLGQILHNFLKFVWDLTVRRYRISDMFSKEGLKTPFYGDGHIRGFLFIGDIVFPAYITERKWFGILKDGLHDPVAEYLPVEVHAILVALGFDLRQHLLQQFGQPDVMVGILRC